MSLGRGMLERWYELASVFELAIWHEGLHAGHLSVTLRALSHSRWWVRKL